MLFRSNRLRERDIHKIVDVFSRQLELPGYSRFVSNEEIAGHDDNLNLPRSIDSSEAEEARIDVNPPLAGRFFYAERLQRPALNPPISPPAMRERAG